MGRHPTRDELSRIHVRLGGNPDEADIDCLDRTIAKMQWAGPGPHIKAAVLFCGIARCRPFADLNLETALHATIWFYEINGWTLRGDRPDSLVRLLSDAAMGQPADEVAEFLETLAEEDEA